MNTSSNNEEDLPASRFHNIQVNHPLHLPQNHIRSHSFRDLQALFGKFPADVLQSDVYFSNTLQAAYNQQSLVVTCFTSHLRKLVICAPHQN